MQNNFIVPENKSFSDYTFSNLFIQKTLTDWEDLNLSYYSMGDLNFISFTKILYSRLKIIKVLNLKSNRLNNNLFKILINVFNLY